MTVDGTPPGEPSARGTRRYPPGTAPKRADSPFLRTAPRVADRHGASTGTFARCSLRHGDARPAGRPEDGSARCRARRDPRRRLARRARVGTGRDAAGGFGRRCRPGDGPVTKGASRGILFGAIVGAVAGLAVALPFAAIPMGDLSASTRLWIVAAVGLVFGWFLGWYLGGAFGLDRPEEPLAASRGATLAVPDSDTARQVLVETGSLRVDVIAADGEPVGQLVADHPTPARKVGEIAGDIVRHAREEPTKG